MTNSAVQVKQVVCESNSDGRLELFFIGSDNKIYHNWQIKANDSYNWNGGEPLNGLAEQVAATLNGDNPPQLQLFYIGTDKTIKYDQRDIHGVWNGPNSLGIQGAQFAVANNSDGRLEVFYTQSDNSIHHEWQASPNGLWEYYGTLPGSANQLAAILNGDNPPQLQLFYIGTDNTINYDQRDIHGVWNGPNSLRIQGVQFAVANNSDGRLEVFYIQSDNSIHHKWQTSPNGSWEYYGTLPGSANQLAAILNGDNPPQLDLFYIGTDNYIYYHQRDIYGVWTGPKLLSVPQAKQLAVGRNPNGLISVFFIGVQDDLLYYTFEISQGIWHNALLMSMA